MIVQCPTCDKNVKVKPNGHGRCECGAHIKIIK